MKKITNDEIEAVAKQLYDYDCGPSDEEWDVMTGSIDTSDIAYVGNMRDRALYAIRAYCGVQSKWTQKEIDYIERQSEKLHKRLSLQEWSGTIYNKEIP